MVKCWMYLGTCVNTMQEGRTVYLLTTVQPVSICSPLGRDVRPSVMKVAFWFSSDCRHKLQWAQEIKLDRIRPWGYSIQFYFHFTPHAIDLRRTLLNYTAPNWATLHSTELRCTRIRVWRSSVGGVSAACCKAGPSLMLGSGTYGGSSFLTKKQ